ncbi:MAG: hypothetical protein WDN29_11320 [Methylovirgula sp.]
MNEAVLPPEATKPVAAPGPKILPQIEALAADAPKIDFARFSKNLATLIEQGGHALSVMLQPQADRSANGFAESVVDAVQAFGRIAEYWLSDVERTNAARAALAEHFLSLWAQTFRRMSGEIALPVVPVAPGDKRFAAPQWAGKPAVRFPASGTRHRNAMGRGSRRAH